MSNPIHTHDALSLLREGNDRYQAGELTHPRSDKVRRLELGDGQTPFAAVITCSDSRVVPELIFDQGLGDLFVSRVAGNVADTSVIASMEYAVSALDVRLIVVLGHEKCGAVAAAMKGKADHHLQQLIDMIKPAVDSKDLSECVRANAQLTADELISRSPIVAAAVEANHLAVVPAYYHFDNGSVDFVAGESL